MNEVTADFLTGFLAEAREYVSLLRAALSENRAGAGQELLEEIAQRLDILSGSSQMLGLDELAALVQPYAEQVADLQAQDGELSDDDRQALLAMLDAITPHLGESDGPDQAASSAPAATGLSSPVAVPDTLPDLPPELWEIFLLEANDHNVAIQGSVEQLRSDPQNADVLHELRRVTHTLKGAAATIGVAHMARIAHLMEELIECHLDAGGFPIEDVVDLLYDSADIVDAIISPSQNGGPDGGLAAIEERYRDLLGSSFPPTADEQESQPSQALLDSLPEIHPEENLRVSLPVLDRLINLVGEVIINRTGLEQPVGSLRELILELSHVTRRLGQVSRSIEEEINAVHGDRITEHLTANLEFDSLELDQYSVLYELARELEEISADTVDVYGQFETVTGDLSRGLVRERRLTNELQGDLLATRLVPFLELELRIRRAVQRTARDLGKKVDVILDGFDTKIDKTILDGLVDPLLHLIRNAVDHGLESAEERTAQHKPPTGTLTVRVWRERGRVKISLSDDGKGIDLDEVQQAAVSSGLIDDHEQLDERQVQTLLYREGFSLAEQVTHTSGRGVGLDIVRRAVQRMQGTVQMDSRLGQGTTFTITVPITLAITQTMSFGVGKDRFAVPLEQVSMVIRLDSDLQDNLDEEGVLRYDGRTLPVHELADFVGINLNSDAMVRYGLMVGREGNEQVVMVETIGSIDETVVKSLGPHLRHVPGIVGATITGDGRVILILDLVEIVLASHGLPQLESQMGDYVSPSEVKTQLHALVVDDSLSVRRVVSSFLERAGWQTTIAKDGIDALDKLDQIQPDVALVDIEMPRMNGYELLTRLKADQQLQHIPVVFLTSRSAEKHRRRAKELGVDGYLVKPYGEHQLLDELDRVMKR